jgi:hypothetical protein
MKQLFTSFCLLSAAVAGAQPTLHSGDMPALGESVTYYTMAADPIIGTGPSQTWDLGGADNEGATYTFVAVAGTVGEADFPTATIAMTSSLDPGWVGYFRITGSAFQYLGFHDGTEAATSADPWKLLDLPCAYGTSWNDTWDLSYGGEEQVDDYAFSADGWGTVMGTLISINNVLMVSATSLTLDTVEFGQHIQRYSIFHFFWKPGEVLWIADVQRFEEWVDGELNSVDSYIEVNEALAVGVPELQQNDAFQLFPDPAHGSVTVTGGLEDVEQVSLINSSGEVVLQRLPAHMGLLQEELDISTLTPGLYIVRLQRKGGAQSCRRLVVE